MPDDAKEERTAAQLLADWRAASRDTVAAVGAARVAEMALTAAALAEEAALAVDEAAQAALEAVEAAGAAILALEAAKGDQARAGQDVEVAEHAETEARDRFHRAERERRSEG